MNVNFNNGNVNNNNKYNVYYASLLRGYIKICLHMNRFIDVI